MRTAPLGLDCQQGPGSPQFGVGEADTTQADMCPPPVSLDCQGRRGEGELREKVGNSRGPD